MGHIYLVTNSITKKQYVGQTTEPIATRWGGHLNSSKNPGINKFLNAIHNYGAENFIIEEICNCPNEELNDKEKYYIALYDTFYNGYNGTRGGGNNLNKRKRVPGRYSEEDVITLWDQGYNLQEICKELDCWHTEIKPIFNKYNISEKDIRLRSHDRAYNSPNHKPHIPKILQYNFSGELIKSYNSFEEIYNLTNYDISNVRYACNHKIKSAYNSLWRYDDDMITIENLIENNKSKERKPSHKSPVLQYDLDGNFIKEYPSALEAAKFFNVDKSTIANAVKGQSYQSQGFLWKYKDDPEDIQIKVLANKNKKACNRKQVSQYTLDGEYITTYSGVAEAAKAINKFEGGSSISKACRGVLTKAYGYKWAYADENK